MNPEIATQEDAQLTAGVMIRAVEAALEFAALYNAGCTGAEIRECFRDRGLPN